MSVRTRNDSGRTIEDVYESKHTWRHTGRQRIEDLTWTATDDGAARRVHAVLTEQLAPSALDTEDWIEYLRSGPRTFALKCVAEEPGLGTHVVLTAQTQNEVLSSREPSGKIGSHDPHGDLVASFVDHYHPVPVAYDDVAHHFESDT